MTAMGLLWVENKVTRVSHALLAMIVIPLAVLFMIDLSTYVIGVVMNRVIDFREDTRISGVFSEKSSNMYNENVNIKRIRWYRRTNIKFSDKRKIIDNFLRVNKDD